MVSAVTIKGWYAKDLTDWKCPLCLEGFVAGVSAGYYGGPVKVVCHCACADAIGCERDALVFHSVRSAQSHSNVS